MLPLIQTTDIHGYVVYKDNSAVHYRLAYIADKAEDLRRNGQDRLLLLDGGDLYQGASISNLMSGWPIYASMDKMGYDAVALGNHEFDWDIDTIVDSDATLPDYEWKGSVRENLVPVLCANLYKDGERAACARDYVVVEKSAVNKKGETIKVKIGIIGFAVNYAGSIMASKFSGRGYSINADSNIVKEIAGRLESSGECDATIVLAHGEADDVTAAIGWDSKIDLVLGGHSHRTLSGEAPWGLAYLQGGRYCEHYASCNLNFSLERTGKILFKSVDGMQIHQVYPNLDRHDSPGQNAENLSSDVLEISEFAMQATAQAQNEILGHINVDASTYYIYNSGNRASNMSNWMCDIIRRIGDADVAFVNSGGVRTYFTLNGSRRDITVANVFEMFPFDNEIYVYRLTYAELLTAFEYSLTSGGNALFSRMTGIDCYFSGRKVVKLVKDGTTIYSNGSWTGGWESQNVIMAVSSYVATTERTDNYTGKPNPCIEWNSTSRLLDNSQIDNVSAVRVLKEEAAKSGGLLYIDTTPHFIEW